jgi:hypothetical protein
MAQHLSALVMAEAGLGGIGYAMLVAVTAVMVMFVVETVNQHS